MSRLILFFIGLMVWLGLSWPPDLQHLLVGIFVAGFVSYMTGDMFINPVRPNRPTGKLEERSNGVKRPYVFKHASRYLWFLLYLPFFIWECLKANIDVAYRVIHPSLPINPGIVKVKTSLKSDTALTFLANSITLTPGTLSVDIDQERGFLYVHWIDVKDEDIERATKLVVERFERILRRIFE